MTPTNELDRLNKQLMRDSKHNPRNRDRKREAEQELARIRQMRADWKKSLVEKIENAGKEIIEENRYRL